MDVKYSPQLNNEQSTSPEQLTHEQIILQLIQHNDVQMLKDLGIKTKDMNFLDSYPEADLDNKIAPLIYASYLGKLDIVKMLIDNPFIDLDISSEDSGQTPLTAACLAGNYEIVQLLLEAGAEVNKPTVYYQTPFICCFQRLEEEQNVFENRKICLKMAELCLIFGADIDWIVERSKGYSLLMQLASIKMDLSDLEKTVNYEIIRFLLESGANTKIKTLKGKIAYDLANKHCNRESIQYLLKSAKQIYSYDKGQPQLQQFIQEPQQQPQKKQSKSIMQYFAVCKN